MPKQQKIDLSRSEFAENFLYLNGRKFSLDDYPFMRRIYDSPADKVVLKTSRQVSKSTTLANIQLANSAMRPYYRQLYVSPSMAQTQEFARDKLEPVILQSPLYQNYMLDPHKVQNVFKKEFKNGSVLNLRYALLNADRIRGISANEIMIDECQDMLYDNIGVIEETMSRSPVKRSWYAGTPKRTKGTLAKLWFSSTMYEYAIKSSRSGKWNILGEENIGQTGLICSKTGLPLDLKVDKGEWVATTPQHDLPAMEGFRISLLHFAQSPWVNWEKDVLHKYENHSRSLFYNESLGLEYDSGTVPITEDDLKRACTDEALEQTPGPQSAGRVSITGIDYGPVTSENSYTITCTLQERGGYLQVVHAKRYVGEQASYSYIHEEIPEHMKRWKSTLLAADYGMGEASNSEFRKKMGSEKVVAYQYLASQKQSTHWNEKMLAFTLNKTIILNRVFEAIKRGHIRFPKWEQSKQFLADLQNIILEYDEEKNTTKYVNIGPDDFTHALAYAVISAKAFWGIDYI